MNTFRYVKTFTGETGASHFEELEVALEATDFAPPADPVLVAALGQATGSLLLVGGPRDWRGDVPHPTPRRQVFCILEGRFRVTVSAGVSREFGPGDLLLLEDTWGQGHTTQFLSERVVVAAIALEG
jgi:mannose-6-phosphate isomerase-like protein (cupin superfamily)